MANSAYLAAMPPGRVHFGRSRWDSEFAFVGAGGPRVKMMHDSRPTLYNESFPRSLYDPTGGETRP